MAVQVAAITAARGGLNTAYRMVYLFLPALARGLQVEPQAIIQAVAARSALGLGAPLLGSLADLRGRKTVMLAGTATFAAGCLLLTVWPSYTTFFLAMLAVALSRILFDPAGLAYLGDRVAYERRGLVLGVGELAWSGSILLGVPVAGWLMERAGWKAPFPWLAAYALAAGVWLARVLTPDSVAGGPRNSMRSGLGMVLGNRSALALLAVGLLLTAANEAVGIVLGLWLESSFQLQLAALGAASAVIGAAELGGEGLVAGLVDRLGKRRSVAIGILGSGLSALALPALGRTLGGGLLGVFLYYLMFEFTIVASLPLMTEQVPQARATLLAVNMAGFSLGRSLGALVGGPLYGGGLIANAGAAAGLKLAAVLLLLLFVRDRAPAQPGTEAPALTAGTRLAAPRE
jgi:predicted MFS family arabinose efflux permease